MKHRIKQLIALALVLAMYLNMLSGTAFAAGKSGTSTALETAETGEYRSFYQTTTHVNPLYEDEILPSDLENAANDGIALMSEPVYCTTIEAAGRQMRQQMKGRNKTFEVYYKTKDGDYSQLAKTIADEALRHTGVPTEGDYLAYQYAGWNSSLSGYFYGTTYYYTISYTVTYYTTAQQEAALDKAVSALLNQLALNGKSDYTKIKSIYNYICANITYDYINLNNSSYFLKHTAYAALINKTAVCQGYAVLLYRLLEEVGIDCRVISGYGNNEAHGWNIVQIDGKYYNLDSTWDAGQSSYRYFLRCNESFEDHVRDKEYNSSDFNRKYPMSRADYVETADSQKVSISGAMVSLSPDSDTYDGKAKTPAVTVKIGASPLVNGTDYTVAYSNNTNAGTASVTVTGKGNYTGTVTKHFMINKADQTIKASISASGIKAGAAASITAAASGKGALSYKSSNTSVATVSSKGIVTGKGAGTAIITITAAGNSNYKAARKTISVTVSLAAPVLSSVTNAAAGVTIKWGKVTGAAKYRVFRKVSKGSWAKVGDTTSTSYTDKTAKSGTTYIYTVRCISSNAKSFTSSYDQKGKTIKCLSQPSVSSAANTASGVTVKWGKVTGASGYYVYRKAASGSWSKIKKITKGSTTGFTDTAVKNKNGTTYLYTVRAYSNSYISSYMSGKKIVRLTTPAISKATNSASKKMTVKWGKNSSAPGYQIKYVTGSASKTVTVKGASAVSKVISGLQKGKAYKVSVRSYKTVSGVNYYSGWSSAKSVKISK